MKEKHKVWNDVFEIITLKSLNKLKAQGLFDRIIREVSLGKEANVFLVEKEGEFSIAKIYRIAVMDFKKLKNYFLADPRFGKVKSSRYDLIFNWCRKEYRNLVRCYEKNVRIPAPLGYYKNVIIEELIGDKRKGLIAPRLKDYLPERSKMVTFFLELMENVEKMVFDASIVHGDLSEYNILVWKDKPVIIDLSMSLPADSLFSFELLKRDLTKIKNFFVKYLPSGFIDEKIKEIVEKFKKKFI